VKGKASLSVARNVEQSQVQPAFAERHLLPETLRLESNTARTDRAAFHVFFSLAQKKAS
jgi:hypothetical protein